MEILRAFILAAGYGERLRPITDHIPKPLLPICGSPIIESVLGRISSLSPNSIGINTHHKAEQIQTWANRHITNCNISIFHESSILGTGGALKNAEDFLKNSVFIVHNADILTDIKLETLIKKHLASGYIATLAVHGHEKFSNVWTDNEGFLRSVGRQSKDQGSGLCKIAFMGIAVYSPEILGYIPVGNSSVVDAWLRSVAAGHSIGTVDFSGAAWTDIGTPDSYAEAVIDSLRKAGETIYVHKSVECSEIELKGNVAIEKGAVIQTPASISNSILLPGATIVAGTILENSIVGADFAVQLSPTINKDRISLTSAVAEWLGCSVGQTDALNVGAGGSDRAYYRINHKDSTAILMKCSEADQDYIRHITYTRFFRTCSIPVPDIFVIDESNKQALFEDLGDLSLYSWLKCRRSEDEIEDLYMKTLDITIQLHTVATEHLHECPLLQQRIFDYDHFRWETDYFMERFIKGITRIANSDPGLIAEFDRLAGEADTFAKTIVHRDFQSQNIMVTIGDVPRLIDYQGARLGPPAYDIASMLWDPYYPLENAMREKLIDYYIKHMKQSLASFSEPEFRRSLFICRLQRHMQALGAYGFLSREKGKIHFLKHIPQAVAYLKQETALAKGTYPILHELVASL